MRGCCCVELPRACLVWDGGAGRGPGLCGWKAATPSGAGAGPGTPIPQGAPQSWLQPARPLRQELLKRGVGLPPSRGGGRQPLAQQSQAPAGLLGVAAGRPGFPEGDLLGCSRPGCPQASPSPPLCLGFSFAGRCWNGTGLASRGSARVRGDCARRGRRASKASGTLCVCVQSVLSPLPAGAWAEGPQDGDPVSCFPGTHTEVHPGPSRM